MSYELQQAVAAATATLLNIAVESLEEEVKQLVDRRGEDDLVVLSHGEVEAIIHNLQKSAQILCAIIEPS
jgi:hypothetical protein